MVGIEGAFCQSVSNVTYMYMFVLTRYKKSMVTKGNRKVHAPSVRKK